MRASTLIAVVLMAHGMLYHILMRHEYRLGVLMIAAGALGLALSSIQRGR